MADVQVQLCASSFPLTPVPSTGWVAAHLLDWWMDEVFYQELESLLTSYPRLYFSYPCMSDALPLSELIFLSNSSSPNPPICPLWCPLFPLIHSDFVKCL